MNRIAAAWLLGTTVLCGRAIAAGPPKTVETPTIPSSSLGQPNGPAQLDGFSRGSAITVLPQGLIAPRALGDRARDRLSIRDFLPTPACDGVTDDSPTVFAATTALAGTGRAINVPGDCRLNIGPASRLAGNRIVLDGTGLVGESGRDGANAQGVYGTRGGTILLTDTGGPAFIAKRNWRLSHLIFFWPGQTEAAAVANNGTPVVYPALMSSNSAVGGAPSEVSSGEFTYNDVVNAYDVMDFSADVAGGLHINHNRSFYIDNFLRLNHMPLESWIDYNDFTPNPYESAPGMLGSYSTHIMLNYAAAHASAVEAVGNGTSSAASTYTIDGLNFSHNYVFGMGYGLRALGGTFNLGTWSDNSFDGVPHAVSVETGGKVVGGTSLSGGRVFAYTFGLPSNQTSATAAIYLAPDSPPNSYLSVEDVNVPSATTGVIDWEAVTGTLDVSNLKIDQASSTGNSTPVSAIKMAGTGGGRLRVNGSRISGLGTANGYGIEVDLPLQFLTVTSNQFIQTLAPLYIGGSFGTPAKVSGNFSGASTAGGASIVGSQAGSIDDLENTWDLTSSAWAHSVRGADGALLFSFKGTPQIAVTPSGNATVPGRFISAAIGPYTRAVPSAAQTFTGTKTQVAFGSVTTDTTGTFASGTFTAPTTGYYRVFALVESDGTLVTTGDVWTLYIDKAGSATGTSEQDTAVTRGSPTGITVQDVVLLTAGDTIQISLARLSGSSSLTTVADGGRNRLVVQSAQ